MSERTPEAICADDCTSGCHADDCEQPGHHPPSDPPTDPDLDEMSLTTEATARFYWHQAIEYVRMRVRQSSTEPQPVIWPGEVDDILDDAEQRVLLATALAALPAPSADAGGRTGAELIVAERQRQIDEEGYDAAHDSGHADELAAAAATYAIASPRTYDMAYGATTVHVELGVGLWPWDRRWWKPTPDDRIRELVKAGALIAAAIDALEGKS
jgi:hypothetical protein